MEGRAPADAEVWAAADALEEELLWDVTDRQLRLDSGASSGRGGSAGPLYEHPVLEKVPVTPPHHPPRAAGASPQAMLARPFVFFLRGPRL